MILSLGWPCLPREGTPARVAGSLPSKLSLSRYVDSKVK